MHELRNSTVRSFGYDQTNAVEYSFNNLGYRGDEFLNKSPIVILGGSISFGLGIPYDCTFGSIVAKHTKSEVYNFSWGAFGHTNHEQLTLLTEILTVLDPKLVIWQINNLNRVRINQQVSFDNDKALVTEMYYDFLKRSNDILTRLPNILLHWDNEDFAIDFSNCLVYNKYHADKSLQNNPDTFGILSHKLIGHKILKKIQ
jgi:hypothetical protein